MPLCTATRTATRPRDAPAAAAKAAADQIHPALAALLFAVSGATFAADKHEHKPLHGGMVVEANNMDFELVAKAELITVHERDHDRAANVKGATGELTLLSGSAKSEATLVPVGDDRLEARGSFQVAAGTKIVASINLIGKKPINVRFAIK